MTFADLHEILDDKTKKLSLKELKQVIYELKQDCLKELNKLLDDFPNSWQKLSFITKYEQLQGEQNAFQIALDLLEHFDDSDCVNKEIERLKSEIKSMGNGINVNEIVSVLRYT